jgi:hypothetical protein
MNLWKARIDHSLADLVQASAFAAEGEAFLKPGGMMVAWEIRHDDFESLSAEEVDAICERFEQALAQVGDLDLLHVVHHRLPAPTYPESELPTRAATPVDSERRAAFGNERYWLTHSRIYLSHYFPPEATARLSSAFFAGRVGRPGELAIRGRALPRAGARLRRRTLGYRARAPAQLRRNVSRPASLPHRT